MTTIRVIDFETTGLEPECKVIELGYVDYDVENKTVGDTVSQLFFVDDIPSESRAVHHIRLCDIPDGAVPYERFAHVRFPADEMNVGFFAAHNAKFESQWLDLEGKHIICTYKCALRVWPDAPSHSNGALRYWLEDQGKVVFDYERTMPPHRAGPDAYVTAGILLAMFNEGITGKQMVMWSMEPAKFPTCPIGEWRGKPWSEVDAGFLGWMIRKPDMDPDFKWNAQKEIERRQT